MRQDDVGDILPDLLSVELLDAVHIYLLVGVAHVGQDGTSLQTLHVLAVNYILGPWTQRKGYV